MKLAIVYSSISGNTEELARIIMEQFKQKGLDISCYRVEDFPLHSLLTFDGLLIGTYTWGDGEVPLEMVPLQAQLESGSWEHLVTGVFGTGDSFYPKFCGAVNAFRDSLKERTNLAVTLKVELLPQDVDMGRIATFVERIIERMSVPA
ncbi:flavodoxin domain-containing protein [Robertmurraya sp. DFI.2.37]|uniref:flavodoxin domain-containing protein n=1 Tax=Robertmurraya sp. DFI.2.37 TaxID=3031819 RepID=UPI001248D1D6|nr:flavodoxin domain-containing protein [Robertmurraya sp. DFI.2.37]MDF1507393.1 flavodoxin domain-containing protein [Robertmurraya sp. DFI.2.37]